MAGPDDDPRSEPPPRIDRAVLEDVRDRLRTASQFATATIVVTEGQTRLEAIIDPHFDPPAVERRLLDVRWYTNDDFRIHYQEEWPDQTWMERWDRHPSEHNARDHFHPPPSAATPGKDRSWPADYRDVLSLVLSSLADHHDAIWTGDADQ